MTEQAGSEAAALATLDRFMAALNRRDEAALNDALNVPHVRLASGRVTTWDTPGRRERASRRSAARR